MAAFILGESDAVLAVSSVAARALNEESRGARRRRSLLLDCKRETREIPDQAWVRRALSSESIDVLSGWHDTDARGSRAATFRSKQFYIDSCSAAGLSLLELSTCAFNQIDGHGSTTAQRTSATVWA